MKEILRRILAVLPGVAERLDALPPKQAMQKVVYGGVLTLASMLIGLTAYYLSAIQSSLHAQIALALPHDAVVSEHLQLNGRKVTLRGIVEPGQVPEANIQRIAEIEGVSELSNELVEQVKPSPEFRLHVTSGHLNLSGKLNGDDLESISTAVGRAFPDHRIVDHIKIDDRLGRPLWIDQIDGGLKALAELEDYRLYGWRDAVLIQGTARSKESINRFRYSLPLYLRENVQIDQQLRVKYSGEVEYLNLVSGWNGTALSAMVSSHETANLARANLPFLSGYKAVEAAALDIVVDEALKTDSRLQTILTLFPYLSKVQDLRLVKNSEGYVLWGRVDTSEQLGEIVVSITNAGLIDILDNQVHIDPSINNAEISMFRDAKKVIVSGRLPSELVRSKLIDAIRGSFGSVQIEEFINIEPNIFHNLWLENWNKLFRILSRAQFGLTVAEGRILISGNVPDEANKRSVERALKMMFGEMRVINLLTVN